MINLVDKAYAVTAQDLVGVIHVSMAPLGLGGIITILLSWLIYFAGVLAFIFLVIAGVTYITAGGNPEQAKKAQMGLINAIIGIIVVALSYVILRALGGLTLRVF